MSDTNGSGTNDKELRMVADEMQIVDPRSGKPKLRIDDQNQVLPAPHEFIQDSVTPDICSVCGRTYSQCFKENKHEQSNDSPVFS